MKFSLRQAITVSSFLSWMRVTPKRWKTTLQRIQITTPAIPHGMKLHRAFSQSILRTTLIRKSNHLRVKAWSASSQIVKRLQCLCVQHRFINQNQDVADRFVTSIEARNHVCSSQTGQRILNRSCHMHPVSTMVNRYREQVAAQVLFSC